MQTVAVGWQLYTLTGSALDLGLLGLAPAKVSAPVGAVYLVGSALIAIIRDAPPARSREATTPASLFAGVAFIFGRRLLLGLISLDLFAVLLGGATALLPIYARDILGTGPWGLGLLQIGRAHV